MAGLAAWLAVEPAMALRLRHAASDCGRDMDGWKRPVPFSPLQRPDAASGTPQCSGGTHTHTPLPFAPPPPSSNHPFPSTSSMKASRVSEPRPLEARHELDPALTSGEAKHHSCQHAAKEPNCPPCTSRHGTDVLAPSPAALGLSQLREVDIDTEC